MSATAEQVTALPRRLRTLAEMVDAAEALYRDGYSVEDAAQAVADHRGLSQHERDIAVQRWVSEDLHRRNTRIRSGDRKPIEMDELVESATKQLEKAVDVMWRVRYGEHYLMETPVADAERNAARERSLKTGAAAREAYWRKHVELCEAAGKKTPKGLTVADQGELRKLAARAW